MISFATCYCYFFTSIISYEISVVTVYESEGAWWLLPTNTKTQTWKDYGVFMHWHVLMSQNANASFDETVNLKRRIQHYC